MSFKNAFGVATFEPPVKGIRHCLPEQFAHGSPVEPEKPEGNLDRNNSILMLGSGTVVKKDLISLRIPRVQLSDTLKFLMIMYNDG